MDYDLEVVRGGVSEISHCAAAKYRTSKRFLRETIPEGTRVIAVGPDTLVGGSV